MKPRAFNQELFDHRVERLRKLIDFKAPDWVIAENAELVFRAMHRNSRPRCAARELKLWAKDLWDGYVVFPFWAFLCKRNLWHYGENDPDFGCLICGKGAPECSWEDDDGKA